ncbi:MAG: MarR family transcriptional regulator [Chitinophagales bacterium]|nr:MarR family transcriptional regulator [Chitinophagales bacterium]
MRLEDEIKQYKFEDEYHKLTLNILFTSGWIEMKHIQFFKQYKLSPQQYNVLRILRGQFPKPASVNVLMERMLDRTSNASRLVDKLCEKKLTEKKINNNDRRHVDVVITKEGLNLLEKIDGTFLTIQDAFRKISTSEATTLNELLDKLRH